MRRFVDHYTHHRAHGFSVGDSLRLAWVLVSEKL